MKKSHSNAHTIGVLLTNSGTPDELSIPAVRRYLAAFLSDPRVIKLAKPLWWPILHAIILRTRPKRSLKNYQKIWTDAGSPLLVITKQLSELLVQTLQTYSKFKTIHVTLGMRYGKPSIQQGLLRLHAQQCERIIVLPLFPQYSATTTASTMDSVYQALKSWSDLPELRFIKHYTYEADYINAITTHIANHWQQQNKRQRHYLLFSFHGIPQAYADQGDPYGQQCHESATLIAKQLGMQENEWSVAFQSRFGPTTWLTPYTKQVLQGLPKQGIKNVTVVCPGFSVDCLETLEEIAIRNRNFFMNAGGVCFHYIPALNASQLHADVLANLLLKHMQGWLSQ